MNAATILPPVELLRECFEYTMETGELKWKTRPYSHFLDGRGYTMWNSRFPGTVVGNALTQRTTKRVAQKKMRLTIAGAVYNTSVHRIVLALHEIDVPEGMVIDHIDGNALNNRIENLRVCTHAQNIANCKPYRTTAHTPRDLPKGVYRCRNTKVNRYVSYGSDGPGKKKFLGYFKTIQEASNAFEKHHKEKFGF